MSSNLAFEFLKPFKVIFRAVLQTIFRCSFHRISLIPIRNSLDYARFIEKINGMIMLIYIEMLIKYC